MGFVVTSFLVSTVTDSNSPSEDDRSTIASLLDEVTKADVASFEIGFFLGLFATIAWRRRGVLSDDA